MVIDSSYLITHSIWLQPSTVVDIACATCTPGWGYKVEANTFCVQNIRRGVMVYQGAVDLSYWHRMFDEILTGSFINKEPIGAVYLKARNSEYQNSVCIKHMSGEVWPCGDPYYALIGDPTFVSRWW
jgi:hypothetical protein